MEMNREVRGQIERAYGIMARIGHRPGAPSEGGHVTVSLMYLDLDAEIREYAYAYWDQESSDVYRLGVPDPSWRVAFILAVEAARVMSSGEGALARRLLEAAVNTLPDRPPVPSGGRMWRGKSAAS